MISLEKQLILTPFQKLPKNVRDLGKLIFAKGFKKCKKSPNLVTLFSIIVLPLLFCSVSQYLRYIFLPPFIKVIYYGSSRIPTYLGRR